MEHFKVFRSGDLTAVHRAGILRFELEMAEHVLVGTIKEIDDVAQADWNVGLIPMKLVFVDLLDAESLECVDEGVAKSAIIESAMWRHGDQLAQWFVEGELEMSLKEVGAI